MRKTLFRGESPFASRQVRSECKLRPPKEETRETIEKKESTSGLRREAKEKEVNGRAGDNDFFRPLEIPSLGGWHRGTGLGAAKD